MKLTKNFFLDFYKRIHFLKMERKRELFKRYLEEKKVMDTLSKIIVSLYELPERPQDPLTFIRDFFTDTGGIDIANIRTENFHLAKDLEGMKTKLADLEKKKNNPKAQSGEEVNQTARTDAEGEKEPDTEA